MNREQLIDAGAEAWAIKTPREVLADIIDAVEPLIRADEREFLAPEVPMARDDLRNELRAQVEALPAYGGVYVQAVSRADVLALIDREDRE